MEQIQVLSRRLRVPPNVQEKSCEYLRLAELKSSTGIQPSCLAAVCLELACTVYGEPVDKKQLQKLSGVQSKIYNNSFQIIEKVLKIESRGTLQDLAIRFGYPESRGTAEEILSSYQKHLSMKFAETQYQAIDFTKPLYPTAALYTACRLLKIRCDKTKFISLASANKSMFQTIHEEMNKCIPESLKKRDIKKVKAKKPSLDKKEQDDAIFEEEEEYDNIVFYSEIPSHIQNESWDTRWLSNPFRRDYVIWKEKIITDSKNN